VGGDRSCGPCSLCCTLLRVDELAKLGGRPCLHQLPAGGCAVHPRRPGVCRAYRCAWLGGAFEQDDRPDRLGAVLDLLPRGPAIHLVVRLADADALARSPRLRAIVQETRAAMPVEIRDVEDVLDPERPYRVLQPDGSEHRVAGARLELWRDGRCVERRRAPWLERLVHAVLRRLESRRLSRWPSHEERLARLGLPGDKLGGSRPPGPGDAPR